MSCLRHLCFPSTAQFSVRHLGSAASSSPSLHKLSQPSHSLPPPSLSLSSFSSFSKTLAIRHGRPDVFLFCVSSSKQAQTSIESPKIEESESEREQEEENEASRTRLLAQNVPWTCTADDLRPLFEKYGTVVDIELSMFNKTRNRGLAFVTMGSPEEARSVLTYLESYEYEGRALKMTWAKPKPKPKKPSSPPQPKPVPVHNLFVANLPFQTRANDLKEFFNAANANVVSAEIIFHDNPRRSAGYGFVSFNTKEESEAALSSFQGKEFMGRQIRVARSKRFLRQSTKVSIQSENISNESNANAEQPQEVKV